MAMVVIDTVDVHWIRETRHAELSGDSSTLMLAGETRRRETRTYREADYLIAVSDVDRKNLESIAPGIPVEVIALVAPVHCGARRFESRRDLAFIENFAHKPNPDAVEFFISEIFPAVRRRIDSRLLLVGKDTENAMVGYSSSSIIVVGRVAETFKYLRQVKMLIAPIRFGSGIKGKIAEALAAGTPVVTTSVGSEGMELRDGSTALIRDTPQAFAEAIVSVYTDEGVWDTLSCNGRKHAEQQYSRKHVLSVLRRCISLGR